MSNGGLLSDDQIKTHTEMHKASAEANLLGVLSREILSIDTDLFEVEDKE